MVDQPKLVTSKPRRSLRKMFDLSSLVTENIVAFVCPGVRLTKVCRYHDEFIFICLQYTPDKLMCKNCGHNKLKRHERNITKFTHTTPVNGVPGVIRWKQDRYICPHCQCTSTPELPGILNGHRVTVDVEEYICRLAVEHSFASIGRMLGIDPHTVSKIFFSSSRVRDTINSIETPIVMGVDGVYVQKKSALTLTSIDGRYIVDVYENGEKSKDAREGICKQLRNILNFDKISVVVIDPSDLLRIAILDVLWWVVIIVDKWHMIRSETKFYNKWRWENRKMLAKAAQATEAGDRICAPASTAKNESLLKERNDRAHLLGLFCYVYQSSSRSEALQRLQEWEAAIPEYLKKAYKYRINFIRKWTNEILNYFDFYIPYTAGFTENRNRYFGDMNAARRGHEFSKLRVRVLYSSQASYKVRSLTMTEVPSHGCQSGTIAQG